MGTEGNGIRTGAGRPRSDPPAGVIQHLDLAGLTQSELHEIVGDQLDAAGVRRSVLEYESAGLLLKGTAHAALPSKGWGLAGLVSVPVLTGACNLQQPDAGVPPRR